jgi:hypothetical protein
LVPDLEAGNMLAKNLSFVAKADSAGIVLGARVPIILTSRTDSLRGRVASCSNCGAVCRCPTPRFDGGGCVKVMDTIVVANAGSSSVNARLRLPPVIGRAVEKPSTDHQWARLRSHPSRLSNVGGGRWNSSLD